jgi:hypothetical protein
MRAECGTQIPNATKEQKHNPEVLIITGSGSCWFRMCFKVLKDWNRWLSNSEKIQAPETDGYQ